MRQFMAEYWHRKPLLIRNAFADFEPPAPLSNVVEFATLGEANVRLIQKPSAGKAQWQLTHQPKKLPSMKKPGWTALIQAAECFSAEVAQLLHQFRFVGDSRLDDLMISVASDQGGVGPHIDSYDVFLLQAAGQRHWRWGQVNNPQTQPDQPLKILAEFIGGEQAVLNPGDMLYLPPGWAHDGVAIGPCMTYSIGFRASTRQELICDVYGKLLDQLENESPISSTQDAPLVDSRSKPSETPARLGAHDLDGYLNWLENFRPSKPVFEELIARHLSDPRFFDVFKPAKGSQPTIDSIAKQMQSKALYIHHAARGLYLRRQNTYVFFLNGEQIGLNSAEIAALFDQRFLPAGTALSPDELQTLVPWLKKGWLVWSA